MGKVLALRHEDMSSIPSTHPCKTNTMAHIVSITPALGRGNTGQQGGGGLAGQLI